MGKVIDFNKVKRERMLDSAKKSLIAQGLNKEDARAFLPSNVQCNKLYMTFTLSSLYDFLILRTDKHAQAEIRSYANDIKGLNLIPKSEMF